MQTKIFQTPQKFNECLYFSSSGKNQLIFGFSNGEKSFFAGCMQEPVLIVVADFISASAYKAQLASMGKRAEIVSGGIDSPVFVYSQDLSQIRKMIVSISKFACGQLDALIILPEALCQRLPQKQNFLPLVFEKGKNYDLEQITKSLLNMGYTRQTIVSGEGEFSLRGDILDIFVVGGQPVRLNFFGDELEQAYTFLLEDLKKQEEVEQVFVFANTIYFRPEPYSIIDTMQDYQKSLNLKGEQKLKFDQTMDAVVGSVERNQNNLNLAFSTCFDKNLNTNILGMFCEHKLFVDEPKKVQTILEMLYSSFASNVFNLLQDGLLAPIHYEYYFSKENIFPTQMSATVFSSLESNTTIYTPQKVTTFSTYPATKYLLNYKSLVSDIKQYQLSRQKVVLFCGDEFSRTKIEQFLIESGIAPSNPQDVYDLPDGIFVLEQELAFSVLIGSTNTILIGSNDLVKKTTKMLTGKKKSVFYLPKVGEYVVHEFHGIGKCVAIKRLKLSNYEKDYFVLEYANGDKIYVPTEQADTISAYMGGDSTPKLNKLGGAEFAKVKERAKKAISELAINLIELYRQRENSKGFAFEKDSYLQQAFEDAFEFEETPDQLQAIIDAKQDMTSTRIMDRLVCGDVGYGKTEVALRCAYKAVLSGKQVAILCPTTILSEQHYKTCQKRFKDFMVRVGLLNRLVPQGEQKKVLKQLKEGNIDVIIGTHRLLASDVQFADLGLLILDEEQRFGVQDKEKIKQLKKNIDVLTLSATPIPRTLHMSLSGIRDISIIETPPKNRIPVQTYVCEYDDAIIETAVNRELARNGQVYIVYNRVESIFDFASQIQAMFPKVAVGVAHGQMDRKSLEDAVMKLYGGQYQILIATTLIENGIDIPTANTLIVVDADKLGLSSLYQLKGRVGRSGKMAYAYFTYKKDKVLTQDAFTRLSAITEFSSLGSGFKIAMRDLEIRGAGTVLGDKQHGHIEKVGYDLYCRLLEEAISDLKGQKHRKKKDIKMDVSISAFIPTDYIADENERIKQYTNISLLSTLEEQQTLVATLQNAYGQVPKEVNNLCAIALIKNICQNHDVKSVIINKNKCQLQLYKKEQILDEFLAKCLETHKNKAVLKFELLPIIDFEVGQDVNKKVDAVLDFLTKS